MSTTTRFQRAIFISWFCSIRDCTYCYLSTRQHVKQNPKKDRRSLHSVLAEAILCKQCGWGVDFISGGCDSFSDKELVEIFRNVSSIIGNKLWLNLGVMSEKQLTLFKPYMEGICGTVECVNPKVRAEVCPSKPLEPIIEMYKLCDKVGLKKAMTIIIGLGETIDDFENLKSFVNQHGIDRITFYRLKPLTGTPFEGQDGPSSEYYISWIKKTREAFPTIEIITGSWITHYDELHQLFNAGSEHITKFPSIRQFNSSHAQKIESEASKAGLTFGGTLTKMPDFDIDAEINNLDVDEDLKPRIKTALLQYMKQMKKEKN